MRMLLNVTFEMLSPARSPIWILLVLVTSALLTDQVSTYPSGSTGTFRCAYTNNTSSQNGTEECNKAFDSKQAVCSTVFHNRSTSLELSWQGCWIGSDPACELLTNATDPNRGICQERLGSQSRAIFCCCLGDMCNKDYRVIPPSSPDSSWQIYPPVEVVPPDKPKPKPPIEKPEATFSVVLRYVVAPAVGLLAIACLSFMGQRKRRQNLLAQHDSEKSSSDTVSPLLPLSSITLVQLAAQGRFGAVWRGMYHDSAVAVKIFSAGERQSWLKEIEVYRLPQMQHPNILRFIGAGQQANAQSGLAEYWLLTTWHDLGSLHDFLNFNTVTYSQLLHLADSIAKGIMHLHTDAPATKYETYKPAIAHRDIKSKNIILKDDRTACIADFGLAILFEPGVSIGDTHGQVGTRRYMAPEVLEGAISFDQEAFQRIDIYAAALVLWELLGRTVDCDPLSKHFLPFEDHVGQNPSLEDMQEVVVNRKIRPHIRDSWKEDKRTNLLATTLEDCWDADGDARLSASTLHERLHYLISSQWAIEVNQNEKSALLPKKVVDANYKIV